MACSLIIFTGILHAKLQAYYQWYNSNNILCRIYRNCVERGSLFGFVQTNNVIKQISKFYCFPYW